MDSEYISLRYTQTNNIPRRRPSQDRQIACTCVHANFSAAGAIIYHLTLDNILHLTQARLITLPVCKRSRKHRYGSSPASHAQQNILPKVGMKLCTHSSRPLCCLNCRLHFLFPIYHGRPALHLNEVFQTRSIFDLFKKRFNRGELRNQCPHQ